MARFRIPDIVQGAAPLIVGLTMVTVFVFARPFYERYLFSFQDREHQAIELATFVLALLAGIILARSSLRLWERGDAPWFTSVVRYNQGAVLMMTLGLSALFFAGEEVNWGQIFYHWDLPQEQIRTEFGALSVHNMEGVVRVQTVGGGLLVFCFVILPLAWRFHFPGLHVSLEPALPDVPGASAMLTAFLFSRLVWDAPPGSRFLSEMLGPEQYRAVLGQLDELVELLVACAFFIYAVRRTGSVCAGK